jgi:hypothetical protein
VSTRSDRMRQHHTPTRLLCSDHDCVYR